MQVLHTLGDYLHGVGDERAYGPSSRQSPLSRVTVSACTARTDWILTPLGSSERRSAVAVTPRSASIRSPRGTTELYRIGRSAILELNAQSTTPHGPVTVHVSLHTRPGLPLSRIAQSRAQRLTYAAGRPSRRRPAR